MMMQEYSSSVMLRNSSAVEGGLKITAQLKRWGEPNYNGLSFERDSYDEFITDYFERNSFNIPVTVMHGHSFADIVGVVDALEKKEEGLFFEGTIFREFSQFAWLEKLISHRVIQGVSDDGYLLDYEEKDGVIVVKKAAIQNISLVTTPAEERAAVSVENTAFSGFQPRKKRNLWFLN